MSERKQDFSCFFRDEYNLQTGSTEEDTYYNNLSETDGPKVLTTMRNMFAEEKSDDYELVYDIPGQSQHVINAFRFPAPAQNFQIPAQHLQNQMTLQPHQIPHQIQNFGQNQNPTPSHQNQPEGPMEEEEDHEEEDHEDDDLIEDNRIVHQCPECDKKYTSERRLKHHIQVHKNADAYKCPKCGYCYQSPDSLRRHWKKTPNCDEALAKALSKPSDPLPDANVP